MNDMMISHHMTDHIQIWNPQLWFNDWFYR